MARVFSFLFPFFLSLSFWFFVLSVFSLQLSVVVLHIFTRTINPFQSIPSEFLLANEDYMLFSALYLCARLNEKLPFLSVALKFIYNLMIFGQNTFFSVKKKRRINTTTKSLHKKVFFLLIRFFSFFIFEKENRLN